MKTEFYGAASLSGQLYLLHFLSGASEHASLSSLRELSAYCPQCDIDYIIYATGTVKENEPFPCPHCGHHLNFMNICGQPV